MRCRPIALFAVLSLAISVGCGDSKTPATASAAGTPGGAPADPIARVVYNFFDAVRRGEAAEANQYLTPLALQRITEQQMNVTPPGSPTAQFQVGAVRAVEDHALVELTWSDVDADGKRYSEPLMACELRICDGQWRICGMAQDRGPGLEPMRMDFEVPASTPQVQAKAAPTTGGPAASTASDPVGQGKQVAQDPFLQPVQR